MFFQLYFYTVPFLHPSRLGSAARRLCIFFAYRWLPCDHGPSCTLAPCLLFVAAVRVFTPPSKFAMTLLCLGWFGYHPRTPVGGEREGCCVEHAPL